MSENRLRLVVFGDSYVGKSAVIKRFLTGKFITEFVPTVEDLYSHDFQIGETSLKVDILDTAGDAQFPAMRRLSIASAHAFLLVYSVTNPMSFLTVKQRFEEIREQRTDFQDIPIIVAGNKIDVIREIEPEDIQDWVQRDLPKQRTKVLDCSAAENMNISEIFKSFLILAKIDLGPNFVYRGNPDGSEGIQLVPIVPNKSELGTHQKLRRNLSAYGRLKNHDRNKNSERNKQLDLNEPHNKIDRMGSSGPTSTSVSPENSPRDLKLLGFNFSPFSSPAKSKPTFSNHLKGDSQV